MAGGREGEIAGRTEKLLLGERRRGGGGDFNILEKQEGHERERKNGKRRESKQCYSKM